MLSYVGRTGTQLCEVQYRGRKGAGGSQWVGIDCGRSQWGFGKGRIGMSQLDSGLGRIGIPIGGFCEY